MEAEAEALGERDADGEMDGETLDEVVAGTDGLISKPITLHGSFVTVIAPPETVPGSAAGVAVNRLRLPPGVNAKTYPPAVPR